MDVVYSNRLASIPPYLFAEIERKISEKKKSGMDVISLGIGDPDIPTPNFILRELAKHAKNGRKHNYSSSRGEDAFRLAVADWYEKRFGVKLDADKEVTVLIGSKEGLANIARAFVNPGDKVLVPDPAYPVYAQGATLLCDGVPVKMALKEENGFLPNFDEVNGKGAKLLYVNYPNNPTGAIASSNFMKRTADFAEENNLVLCYDNAYSEFTFDDYVAPSMLQYSRNCIEFHSCSKTFCMTGDRIGFAVGDARLIEGLRKVKSQIDSGPSEYVQLAGITALSSYKTSKRPKVVEDIMKEYERRRDAFAQGLNSIGLPCTPPAATFYFWLKIKGSSLAFAEKALDVGVVCTPGIGFGEHGEGFVRFALTQPVERINEAVERLKKIV